VAGPSGVRDVRQTAPAASVAWVGSPPPWRCTDKVRGTSSGNGAG
jgi:hypothetical protein